MFFTFDEKGVTKAVFQITFSMLSDFSHA